MNGTPPRGVWGYPLAAGCRPFRGVWGYANLARVAIHINIPDGATGSSRALRLVPRPAVTAGPAGDGRTSTETQRLSTEPQHGMATRTPRTVQRVRQLHTHVLLLRAVDHYEHRTVMYTRQQLQSEERRVVEQMRDRMHGRQIGDSVLWCDECVGLDEDILSFVRATSGINRRAEHEWTTCFRSQLEAQWPGITALYCMCFVHAVGL